MYTLSKVFARRLPKGFLKINVYLALNSLIVSYVFYRNQRLEVIQNMLRLKTAGYLPEHKAFRYKCGETWNINFKTGTQDILQF